MQYLLVDIAAPLMSWGSTAKGTYRPTDKAPTKSALLGLVTAAVGIDREDRAALGKFFQSYGVATAILRQGKILSDYHTVMTVGVPDKALAPFTRRGELEDTQLKHDTVLTDREYLMDAHFRCAIWQSRDKAPYSMEELKVALQKPHFPLYFGRKCCVPGIPLRPRILDTNRLQDAFLQDEVDRDFSNITFLWEGEESQFDRKDFSSFRRDQPVATTPFDNGKFGVRSEYTGGVE